MKRVNILRFLGVSISDDLSWDWQHACGHEEDFAATPFPDSPLEAQLWLQSAADLLLLVHPEQEFPTMVNWWTADWSQGNHEYYQVGKIMNELNGWTDKYVGDLMNLIKWWSNKNITYFVERVGCATPFAASEQTCEEGMSMNIAARQWAKTVNFHSDWEDDIFIRSIFV